MPKWNRLLDDLLLSASLNPLYMPSDSGMGQQWHLRNKTYAGMDLNLQTVWDEYKGAGVTVGVLDDGFDYKHTDLAKNFDQTRDYDFYSNDADSYIGTGNKHGTAVAGVIAADDNGSGSVGVAPDAQLVGYRVAFGSSSLTSFTNALLKAADNVDILNNSWGISTMFWDDSRKSTQSALFNALDDLAQSGRDGLGTVTVFAAGNNRSWGDNVNYHGIQNSPYVVTVGSTDITGKYSYYSTPGAAVLVSAPGKDIYTTDNTGSAGFSSGNHVAVSGTSFAAPAVSGVVALMLDANPGLGYRDVQEILAYSAKNSDPGYADWQFNGAHNWNNTGLHYSHQYGYGLVDAYAAVRLAEHWEDVSTQANMLTIKASAAPGVAITDKNTVTSSITVTNDILIDHVVVNVNMTHARAGELELILTSPDGTRSILMDNPGARSGNTTGSTYAFSGFEFSSVAHWGESGKGTWTLSVYDRLTGNTGLLRDWTLTLTGDAAGADDYYVYTNEYAKYGSTVLSDANGGTDTINITAVTGNSTVDLRGTVQGVIAGKSFKTNGAVIENILTGDGHDVIYGNTAHNRIHGGRGNDTIHASAGQDTLDGGTGSDTVLFTAARSDFFVEVRTVAELWLSSLSSGLTKALNFEWFRFNGQTYSLQDMIDYGAGVIAPPASPPPPPVTAPEPPVTSAPVESVDMSFRVLTSSGNTVSYSFDSDQAGQTILSSSDLKSGPGNTDEVLTIDRTASSLTVTGNGPTETTMKEITVTTGADIEHRVSGFTTVRINAQNADEGLNATIDDAQSAYIYTANAADRLHITVDNRTGETSSTLNYVRAYLYGADDIMTLTGSNPYFRSYVDLGAGNDRYNSAAKGTELIYGRDGNDIIKTGDGSDTLYGHNGNDSLDGGAGNDRLYGGDGDDTLYSGAGTDSLRGDAGADSFVITMANANSRIEDFKSADGDKLFIANILDGYHDQHDLLPDILAFVYDSRKGVTNLTMNDGAGPEIIASLRGNHAGLDIQQLLEAGILQTGLPETL